MTGIKYDNLDDLNWQANMWCEKVNGKVHATTNEIPKKRVIDWRELHVNVPFTFVTREVEKLNELVREYIINRTNVRKVEKDSLFSYEGSKYSVPTQYAGKYVTVVALDNTLMALLIGVSCM